MKEGNQILRRRQNLREENANTPMDLVKIGGKIRIRSEQSNSHCGGRFTEVRISE
jgi:hypothetical protein